MSTRRANRNKKFSTRTVRHGTSSGMASEDQATRFLRELEELLRFIDHEDVDGYGASFEAQVRIYIGLYNVRYQPLFLAWVAPAAAAGWMAANAKPMWMTQEDYDATMGVIDAYDVANFGGVAAPAPLDTDALLNHRYSSPTEEEFDEILCDVLMSLAHSGFSGVGDLTQTIAFTYQGMPLGINQYYTFELSQVAGCLPNNTTFMNIGRYYANTIASTAKVNDIHFAWGKKHGVPAHLNHLGFAAWDYITDKSLLNDENRRIMFQATKVALRDSAITDFQDPNAPVDHTNDSVLVNTQLAALNYQANLENRQRRTESRMSMFTSTQRSGRGGSRRGDSGSN